jgi:hypothetical protein
MLAQRLGVSVCTVMGRLSLDRLSPPARSSYTLSEMHKGNDVRIEWLSSRQDKEAVETAEYTGFPTRAALIHAKASFHDVLERHPDIIGCRLVDVDGLPLGHWFAEDDALPKGSLSQNRPTDTDEPAFRSPASCRARRHREWIEAPIRPQPNCALLSTERRSRPTRPALDRPVH